MEVEKLFFEVGQARSIEVTRPVRLACIVKTLEIKPHVEVIDLAPGIFKLHAIREDVPKRRLYVKLDIIKSYRKKKAGRYA